MVARNDMSPSDWQNLMAPMLLAGATAALLDSTGKMTADATKAHYVGLQALQCTAAHPHYMSCTRQHMRQIVHAEITDRVRYAVISLRGASTRS